MDNKFMLAREFVPGAQVRAGKGFRCLREGSVQTVITDSVGNPCLRCQFEGQTKLGWHYPLHGARIVDDTPLSELYLEGVAVTSGKQSNE